MTDAILRALDAMPWGHLESGREERLTEEMRRALLHLRDRGTAATEEDSDALYTHVAPRHGGMTSASTAALPYIVALAGDPGVGARNWIVQLLVHLSGTAASPEPDGVDPGWHEMWRRLRPALPTLLADPDPAVRREALPLADGIDPLLERWDTETDPTVRLPLLLALGAAASDSGEAAARVRAVVREVLRTGPDVLRVAAVHAWAAFDALAPVRELDLLVEVLSDTSARPRFEDIWYEPNVDDAYSRTDLVWSTATLFEDMPATALRFVLRLVGAARRTGDSPLCAAALDEAWRLLVVRPSTASELLPLAGELLADPDAGVRYRAAHLLAVLGVRAAPYADGLAALLDDPGEAGFLDGTVGEHARWALTRIGDPRAMPELIERLYEPYRGQYSRSYTMDEPRRPEEWEVLTPLRAHAEVLLPPIRALLREDGADGPLTGTFLKVLKAWGPAAAPALPEVAALVNETRHSLEAVDALAAMGPAAAAAEPAVRACTVLEHPGKLRRLAWAAWRLGGDRDTALRLVGEAALSGDWYYATVGLLGDFGPAALPYAGAVRQLMADSGTRPWAERDAAVALWSITGEAEPSLSVLEKQVLSAADDESHVGLLPALRAITRIGTVPPGVRAALHGLRETDRRLSPYRDYRAFLEDEEVRSVIDEALALPTPPPPSAA
ncbi:HEAT repeat domain-containing protein [Streptomyces sp. NPDC093970]|uniref:HEAT repeat domain-containing protein n=1 Tax=Streptomyces sp. NPDC093970 TaxID=3155076 RepID=UPI0034205099